MNKGTEIEKVISYLEKRKQEGYTPDKMYDSSIFYDECSRKNEGVLRIGSSCPRCLTCFNYSKYRKEDTQ